MGFEPTTTGITIRYSNQLSYTHHRNSNIVKKGFFKPTNLVQKLRFPKKNNKKARKTGHFPKKFLYYTCMMSKTRHLAKDPAGQAGRV